MRYVALGDREGEARVLHKLADLAHDRGDLVGARALFDVCLAIRRAIGDVVGIAEALIGQGDVQLKQGDHEGAASSYGAALALVQARGDYVDRAWATRGLARVARAKGEHARAWQLFAESLRLAWAQSLGDRRLPRRAWRGDDGMRRPSVGGGAVRRRRWRARS